MGDIYKNGHMSISSFKVYRRSSSGSFYSANALMYNQKYRFRFWVVNRAGGYPPIHFDHVRVWIRADSKTKYYESSSYTGTTRTSFQSAPWDKKVLKSGRGKAIYAYFVWRGPDGMQVNNYAPLVGMTARELHYLPNGPVVPLFPNRQ